MEIEQVKKKIFRPAPSAASEKMMKQLIPYTGDLYMTGTERI